MKTLAQKNRICCQLFEVHLGDEIMSNYREIASVNNSQICAMPICCRLLLVDKRKNSTKGMNLAKDYYIDGQDTQLIFFWKNVHWGREVKPPDKIYLMRVKLYFEFTRSWSLSYSNPCSNIAIFWQITWNYRFWPLTTISG